MKIQPITQKKLKHRKNRAVVVLSSSTGGGVAEVATALVTQGRWHRFLPVQGGLSMASQDLPAVEVLPHSRQAETIYGICAVLAGNGERVGFGLLLNTRWMFCTLLSTIFLMFEFGFLAP